MFFPPDERATRVPMGNDASQKSFLERLQNRSVPRANSAKTLRSGRGTLDELARVNEAALN
jgi:hypothetical protein